MPKSPMGDAIGYARRQWGALGRYLDDGELEIDNNRSERALRMVSIGKKTGCLPAATRAAAARRSSTPSWRRARTLAWIPSFISVTSSPGSRRTRCGASTSSRRAAGKLSKSPPSRPDHPTSTSLSRP
jgi:hypothetical protein